MGSNPLIVVHPFLSFSVLPLTQGKKSTGIVCLPGLTALDCEPLHEHDRRERRESFQQDGATSPCGLLLMVHRSVASRDLEHDRRERR